MKVIVHRGTQQIGGCVTEIATEKTRIILDFGTELPDATGKVPNETLAIEGVNRGEPNCSAVLFSHYHTDHTGQMDKILPGIPLYLGSVTKQILSALQRRLRSETLAVIEKAREILPLQKFVIGDLQIVPLPADHSAYDAAMFLISKGKKKVLFTGDFRLHGYRGGATEKIIKKYVGKVDVLITEGTLLSRPSAVLSEFDLQARIKPLLQKYKYVFVLCSSLNIDRLGTFHNNTPKGRYFICDAFQKEIFTIAAKSSVSQYYKFEKALTYGTNLKLREQGFVMPIRQNDWFKSILTDYKDEPGAILLYSMWDGYLDGRDQELLEFIAPFLAADRFQILHTSGHATLEGIRQLVEWTRPDTIIPMHTEAGHVLANQGFASKVLCLADGEVYRF